MLKIPMDFGELNNLNGIDFSFKKARFLSSKVFDSKEWYLGCPVWSNKELLNRLVKTERCQHELQTYSESFNCIELNSSYYSVPTEQQIKRWRSLTPKGFKFFPKAPKDLCFRSYDKPPKHVLNFYFDSLKHFGDQMEESFLQFSPYISPKEKRYLFLLLELLPTEEFNFSIELRHPDWFKNEDQLLRLCEYLYQKDIGLVLTDTPGRRDVLSMIFTTSRAFIRFKGDNASEEDFERINDWAELLNSAYHLEKIYFFHHHSHEENCIKTIDHMSMLITQSKVPIPKIKLKKDSQLSLL
jgi:uncharacterized protein YecE (DUF72 family)